MGNAKFAFWHTRAAKKAITLAQRDKHKLLHPFANEMDTKLIPGPDDN